MGDVMRYLFVLLVLLAWAAPSYSATCAISNDTLTVNPASRSEVEANFSDLKGCSNTLDTEMTAVEGDTATNTTDLGNAANHTTAAELTTHIGVAGAHHTATSIDSITDTNLVDKSATEAITGDWDFSGGGIEIENGITPPSCTEGQLFFDTDATTGRRLLGCESTTFVPQGVGGSVDSIQGDGNTPTTGAILSIDGGTGIDTAVSGDVLTVTLNAALADLSDVTAKEGVGTVVQMGLATVKGTNNLVSWDANDNPVDSGISKSDIGTNTTVNTSQGTQIGTNVTDIGTNTTDLGTDANHNTDAEVTSAIDTELQASTLDWVTTGTLQGGVKVTDHTGACGSIAATAMAGDFHLVSQSGADTCTLPDAVIGLSACFYDNNSTAIISLDVQTGDQFVLDGTPITAGFTIESPAGGARGDFICVLGVSSTEWLTLGRSGTWVAGS